MSQYDLIQMEENQEELSFKENLSILCFVACFLSICFFIGALGIWDLTKPYHQNIANFFTFSRWLLLSFLCFFIIFVAAYKSLLKQRFSQRESVALGLEEVVEWQFTRTSLVFFFVSLISCFHLLFFGGSEIWQGNKDIFLFIVKCLTVLISDFWGQIFLGTIF